MAEQKKLTIGFARRGYSPSGGAEAYLKRLGRGVAEAGHAATLYTTGEWPRGEWPFGEIKHLRGRSPAAFADELEELRRQSPDILMSLDRVHSCNVYRAGDGVHRAWLARRAAFDTPLQRFARSFKRKHSDLFRLEKELLDDRLAERVIVNSEMVKHEIIEIYGYRSDHIDLVRNGIPLDEFRFDPAVRERWRGDIGLEPDEVAALFVGSGWERKGLRFAIDAVESFGRRVRLLVAGRGDRRKYASNKVDFLGEVRDPRPLYSAADMFLLPTIYDPFSNASLEALAMGLPVITTKANGFHEVMEDKIHGSILETPDDAAALAAALELWGDKTRRSAARPGILKRAAQFDISRNVARTLEILLQTAAAAATSGKIRKT